MGFERLHSKLSSILLKYYLAGKRVKIGRNSRSSGRFPIVRNDGEFLIGNDLQLRGNKYKISIVCANGARLQLGNNVFINGGVSIFAQRDVSIGDHAKIGDLCTIFDTNFHQIDEGVDTVIAPVKIGRNVWLGRNVTILPGVTIGDHSVIGAGSIVNQDIPDRVLAAGVPVRVIRSITASDDFVRK